MGCAAPSAWRSTDRNTDADPWARTSYGLRMRSIPAICKHYRGADSFIDEFVSESDRVTDEECFALCVRPRCHWEQSPHSQCPAAPTRNRWQDNPARWAPVLLPHRDAQAQRLSIPRHICVTRSLTSRTTGLAGSKQRWNQSTGPIDTSIAARPAISATRYAHRSVKGPLRSGMRPPAYRALQGWCRLLSERSRQTCHQHSESGRHESRSCDARSLGA